MQGSKAARKAGATWGTRGSLCQDPRLSPAPHWWHSELLSGLRLKQHTLLSHSPRSPRWWSRLLCLLACSWPCSRWEKQRNQFCSPLVWTLSPSHSLGQAAQPNPMAHPRHPSPSTPVSKGQGFGLCTQGAHKHSVLCWAAEQRLVFSQGRWQCPGAWAAGTVSRFHAQTTTGSGGTSSG